MSGMSIRAGVTVVSVGRVIPVVDVDYILLTVSAGLDTSGRYRYITDAFTVVDGMRFSLTKGFTDSFELTDAPPVLTTEKALADSISFTEIFSAILVFLRDFTDTQVFTDAPALTVSKPISNAVTYSDTRSFTLTRSFFDGFAMNDSFDLGDGVTYTYTKTINNVFFATDAFSSIITKAPFTESVAVTDSGLGSMQSYCDITYFAEDYVGFSFSF